MSYPLLAVNSYTGCHDSPIRHLVEDFWGKCQHQWYTEVKVRGDNVQGKPEDA